MTKDEFITEFKEAIIEGVYYNMPKDYRKSNTYCEQDFEERYRQALSHSSFERVLENVIERYYEKINEYEETLGY